MQEACEPVWSGASHPEIDFGPFGPTWIKGTDASTRSMLIDFKLASRPSTIYIDVRNITFLSFTFSFIFLSLVAAFRKNLFLNGKSNDPMIMNEMTKSSQACSAR